MTWLTAILQAIGLWLSGYFKAQADARNNKLQAEREALAVAVSINTDAASLSDDELQERAKSRGRTVPKVYSVPSVVKSGLVE